MENIFAYKHQKNNDTVQLDGEAFIVEKADDDSDKLIDENLDLLLKTQKKYSLPLILTILYYLSGGLSAIIIISLAKSLLSIPISTAYHNAPFLFYLAPIFLAVFLILLFYKRKKQQAYLKSNEYATLEEQEKIIMDNSKTAFHIPDNNVEIDILSYRYVEKNGKKKLKAFLFANYMNICVHAFIKDNSLCFADATMLMNIPLRSVTAFVKQKKKATFPNWNKSEPFNSTQYKPFKIRSNQFGTFISDYYSLHIQDEKGNFEIFIPVYDAKKLADMIGFNF